MFHPWSKTRSFQKIFSLKKNNVEPELYWVELIVTWSWPADILTSYDQNKNYWLIKWNFKANLKRLTNWSPFVGFPLPTTQYQSFFSHSIIVSLGHFNFSPFNAGISLPVPFGNSFLRFFCRRNNQSFHNDHIWKLFLTIPFINWYEDSLITRLCVYMLKTSGFQRNFQHMYVFIYIV